MKSFLDHLTYTSILFLSALPTTQSVPTPHSNNLFNSSSQCVLLLSSPLWC